MVQIGVYFVHPSTEELTTVRLSFDFVLDDMNDNTKEWRSMLAKRLQALLHWVKYSIFLWTVRSLRLIYLLSSCSVLGHLFIQVV